MLMSTYFSFYTIMMWIPLKPAKLTQTIDCINFSFHLYCNTNKNNINILSHMTEYCSPYQLTCLPFLGHVYLNFISLTDGITNGQWTWSGYFHYHKSRCLSRVSCTPGLQLQAVKSCRWLLFRGGFQLHGWTQWPSAPHSSWVSAPLV